jgi:hypothetical protein
MHLFTVTIHTKSLGQKYDSNFLEKIARELFKRFEFLIKKYGLYETVDLTTYWREGCIILDIVIATKDHELIDKYLNSQDEFKKTETYKQLLDIIYKIKDEYPEKEIILDPLHIGIFKILISKMPFKSLGNILNLLSEAKQNNS